MSTQKHSILLVEDEQHLHEALKLNLSLEGYEVSSAYDGPKALQQIQGASFDLIILDIMLPGIDGFSIIETVRIHNNNTPILILSAKNTSANRVQGLKIGADDYMTKPFNLEELLLRVSKLIQKSSVNSVVQNTFEQYSFSGNTVHFTLLEATLYNGEKINLTKKEAMLLNLLIENFGLDHSSKKLEYLTNVENGGKITKKRNKLLRFFLFYLKFLLKKQNKQHKK
jgi:two-component system alkaline phosphatase synthesis response regulator PhoP